MTSRQSKYKNLASVPNGRTPHIENVKFASSSAIDSNLLSANGNFLAINWETAGGGAFAIVSNSEKVRLPDVYPVFTGHEATVLETDFNPFNGRILASGSDDGKINVWNIPAEPMKVNQNTPLIRLSRTLDQPFGSLAAGDSYGHYRRIYSLQFHPTAANVLGSCSMDSTFKLWDVEKGVFTAEHDHGDCVYSFSYNFDGSSAVTTCRDKCFRLIDIRNPSENCPIVNGNGAPKCSRATWLGNSPYVSTSGSRRDGSRGVMFWDTRSFDKPVSDVMFDKQNGILFPYFDMESNLLYVAGKSTSAVHFYELCEGSLNFLSSFRNNQDTKGMAFAPKSCVETSKVEITRAYRAVGNAIEMISYVVPRKTSGFQADLYPETRSLSPTLTADEFLTEGMTEPPKLIPMNVLSSSLQNLNIDCQSSPMIGTPIKNNTSISEGNDGSPSKAELVESYEKIIAEKDARIAQLEIDLARAVAAS